MSDTPYIWGINISADEVGESTHSYSFVNSRFSPLDPAFEEEITNLWNAKFNKRLDAQKIIWYGVVNTSIIIPDDEWANTKSFTLEEALALRRKGLMDLSISRFQADLLKGDGSVKRKKLEGFDVKSYDYRALKRPVLVKMVKVLGEMDKLLEDGTYSMGRRCGYGYVDEANKSELIQTIKTQSEARQKWVLINYSGIPALYELGQDDKEEHGQSYDWDGANK